MPNLSLKSGSGSFTLLENHKPKPVLKISFITGFFCSICICYFVLFRHMLVKTHPVIQENVNLRIVPPPLIISPTANILSPVLSEKKGLQDNNSPAPLKPVVMQSKNGEIRKPVQTMATPPAATSPKIPIKSTINGFQFNDKVYSVTVEENNLVIGIATNTDPKNIAIFAGSLRLRAKSKATVIVFINAPVNAITKRLAVLYQIILIEFKIQELKPSFLHKYHASSLRWILMNSLFASNFEFFSSNYQKILTLDIRDSAFQLDPFLDIGLDEKRFFVFGENQFSKIKECGWNSGWIRDCFGEQALNKIGNEPIICSGISLGLSKHMFQYMNTMSNVLMGFYPSQTDVKDPDSQFPKCERNGVDQGLHNYLIHNHLFPFEVSVKYPDSFPIVNMQAAIEISPSFEDPSTVYMAMPSSGKGGKQQFSVVHQYDRNSDLQLTLGKKYIDWVDWNDLKSEWKQVEQCTYFNTLDNVDLLRGKCDVGSTRAMTPATCCELCVSRGKRFDSVTGNYNDKDCTGFTYVNGVCYFKDCKKDMINDQLREYSNKKDQLDSPFIEKSALSAYIS